MDNEKFGNKQENVFPYVWQESNRELSTILVYSTVYHKYITHIFGNFLEAINAVNLLSAYPFLPGTIYCSEWILKFKKPEGVSLFSVRGNKKPQ